MDPLTAYSADSEVREEAGRNTSGRTGNKVDMGRLVRLVSVRQLRGGVSDVLRRRCNRGVRRDWPD